MTDALLGARVGLIELRLNRLQQLFNSLDPSPFVDKDLDRDAEEFIVGWAEQFPAAQPLRLAIYLPAEQFAPAATGEVAAAVHNYFDGRTAETYRRLRSLLREGRTALFIGLAFLVGCAIAREIVTAAWGHGTAAETVAEGIAILGWVAMWRPLEIFLYEWWPIRRRARLFARLATVPVDLHAQEIAGQAAGPGAAAR